MMMALSSSLSENQNHDFTIIVIPVAPRLISQPSVHKSKVAIAEGYVRSDIRRHGMGFEGVGRVKE